MKKITEANVLRSGLLTVIFFMTTGISGLFGQTASVFFTVIDSLDSSPIEYAMVVATDNTSGEIIFDRTDERGQAMLSLYPNIDYELMVNRLGYANYASQLKLTQLDEQVISITLSKTVMDLAEIVVRDTLPPISYRPDTVVYNARAFYTGKERKLKDLIEKLPGLDIDQNLRVTYQGQDVTTLLVEGKPFFGGDGELALKGLPADAIARIQVLEDYKPLGFTLDPGARKRRALNIIIREDRKNVYFGEAMAGGGTPGRHLVQADIFRFNRNTNNYLFGGSNNVNRELLSIQSILRLIGGDNLLSGNGFQELSDLSLRLSPPSFAEDSKNQLIALGVNQQVGKKSSLDVYALGPRKKWTTRQRSTTVFPITDLNEAISLSRAARQQFGMLRATLTSKLPKQLVIRTNAQLQGNQNSSLLVENYRSNFGNRLSSSQLDVGAYECQLKTEIVKQTKEGNILKIVAAARQQSDRETLKLSSDTAFLNSLFLSGSIEPTIFDQDNIPTRRNFRGNYLYHYKLNRKVYLEQGMEWEHLQQKQSINSSLLPSQQRVVAFHELSTHFGTVVKWRETSTVFRLHLAQIRGANNGERVSINQFLLPEFRLQFRSGPGSTVEANWKSTVTPPGLSFLSASPLVTSFTTYQFGLERLTPVPTHKATLGYRYYNPIKGYGYTISAGYDQQGGSSIIPQLEVVGQDRKITYVVTNTPIKAWNLTAILRRDNGKNKFSVTSSYQRRQQLTVIVDQNVVSPITTASLQSDFRQHLTNEVNVRWSLLINRSGFGIIPGNAIYNGHLQADLSYTSGRWSSDIGLSGQLFDATANAYFSGRISGNLRYVMSNSPWAFELMYEVPLGGREIRSFRQSDLFFSTTNTQVFVAFVTANVAYQF
ncbi:hypothetical protein [Lewinella sp. W8]|uniref:hypothetical protein n=1 Tax=Lewinella sp. W8 TaxID=2528208 RepID=UPI001067321C|nr:hypothetical protein [Lewinella sp. W8]MTB51492.1 hypothetical protein [Lewinella sp. W8]